MKTLFFLLPLLSLNACVNVYVSIPGDVTVEDRIARNPKYYEGLSSQDRKLVLVGQIRKGMVQNTVRMAWGHPDLVHARDDDNHLDETWYYGAPSGGPYYAKKVEGYTDYHYPSYRNPTDDGDWRPSKPGKQIGFVEFRGGKVYEWESGWPK